MTVYLGGVARSMRHFGLAPRRPLPATQVRRDPAGTGSGQEAGESEELVDAELVERFARAGRSAQDIARVLKIPSPTTVRIIAQVLEVPLVGETEPPPLPARVQRALKRAGIDAGHAAAVFDPRHLGVGVRRGIPRWLWPPDPLVLHHLYVTLGLSLIEISDRMRVAYQPLRTAVTEAGIALRHEAEHQVGSNRWGFDPGELEDLYLGRGWSSPVIAAYLGVGEATVLRALHRHHLPVAPMGGNGDKRVRYDDLLADPRVLQALRAAGVALAGADAAILRRALPADLLRTLLVDLRLSTFDVELLTGRPAHFVGRDAAAEGITAPLLPPGVSAADLRAAYLDNGWSQQRICRELGIAGRDSLFRVLDECGIPRRTERANPWDTRPRRAPADDRPARADRSAAQADPR